MKWVIVELVLCVHVQKLHIWILCPVLLNPPGVIALDQSTDTRELLHFGATTGRCS